jgi:hypothetical protein
MKTINKILSFMLLLLMSVVSVSAVNLYDGVNNPDNIADYSNINYLEVNSFINLVFYNSTYVLNEGTNYRLESKPVLYYVLTNNNNIEKSFNFIVLYKTNDLNQTQVLYHTINLSGTQSTQIMVEPTTDYEYISTQIYCVDPNSSTCGAGYQVKQFTMVEEQSVNSQTIFTPLITGVVDLIQINLSIWKVVYYVFIFSIIIGVIVGFMLLLGKLYKFAETHQLIKKRSNHK